MDRYRGVGVVKYYRLTHRTWNFAFNSSRRAAKTSAPRIHEDKGRTGKRPKRPQKLKKELRRKQRNSFAKVAGIGWSEVGLELRVQPKFDDLDDGRIKIRCRNPRHEINAEPRCKRQKPATLAKPFASSLARLVGSTQGRLLNLVGQC